MKIKNLSDKIKDTDIHDIIVIFCGLAAVVIGGATVPVTENP